MNVDIEQIRLIILKIHQRSFPEPVFLSDLHVSTRTSTGLVMRDSTITYQWLSDLNSHTDCRSCSRIFGKYSLIRLYVCFNAEWHVLIVQREINGSKASTGLCALSERNSEWHTRGPIVNALSLILWRCQTEGKHSVAVFSSFPGPAPFLSSPPQFIAIRSINMHRGNRERKHSGASVMADTGSFSVLSEHGGDCLLCFSAADTNCFHTINSNRWKWDQPSMDSRMCVSMTRTESNMSGGSYRCCY